MDPPSDGGGGGAEKDIDVLMYGSMNPRREGLCARLQRAGINAVFRRFVNRAEQERLYPGHQISPYLHNIRNLNPYIS